MSEFNLVGIDICEPDEFYTTDKLEQDLSAVYDKLKLPYGRIEMQTGIQSRGIYHNKKPSDIASLAAANLFKGGKVKKENIDVLIHASVCRDFLEPSTASVVHSNLELKASCQSFDLSNACLGVVSAINVAASMLESFHLHSALIVTGENSTPLITKTVETLLQDNSLTRKSIKKYFANFTIGSAGVAIVISKNETGIGTFIDTQTLSDTTAHTLCQGDGGMDGLVMETDSEELMQAGVALAYKNWNNFKIKMNKKVWDHYICHQVGIHHQKFLYEKLELDHSKDYSTYQNYGNTGSAALPLTLAKAIADNTFNSGDHIALLGIGSGLHTTMTGLRWN